jgi:hypothetical protein
MTPIRQFFRQLRRDPHDPSLQFVAKDSDTNRQNSFRYFNPLDIGTLIQNAIPNIGDFGPSFKGNNSQPVTVYKTVRPNRNNRPGNSKDFQSRVLKSGFLNHENFSIRLKDDPID